jgi:hypothetical protein
MREDPRARSRDAGVQELEVLTGLGPEAKTVYEARQFQSI